MPAARRRNALRRGDRTAEGGSAEGIYSQQNTAKMKWNEVKDEDWRYVTEGYEKIRRGGRMRLKTSRSAEIKDRQDQEQEALEAVRGAGERDGGAGRCLRIRSELDAKRVKKNKVRIAAYRAAASGSLPVCVRKSSSFIKMIGTTIRQESGRAVDARSDHSIRAGHCTRRREDVAEKEAQIA